MIFTPGSIIGVTSSIIFCNMFLASSKSPRGVFMISNALSISSKYFSYIVIPFYTINILAY